ncbi:ankyrin [Delitschia confertaspora ATCC 74209]|uniref:Ankyrin n=1 Tax=Delitschia confertaspora ATCC 74209 TaxID=1513339 RepID=A0A9P4JDY7_9PLEO|nr:ankyrin [Delitschia confertaspora ATCC 74209]
MTEPLSIASSIAGLLSLTIQVTRISYGFISDVRSASSTQKEYLREISALNEVLLRSEEAALSLERGILTTSRPVHLSNVVIDDCKRQLEDLLADLAKPTSSILWPIKDKSLKNRIENLQRFRSVFSGFLTAQTLITASATHRKVSRLSQRQDQQELLEWLGNPLDTSLPELTPCRDTGNWFLESDVFQSWAHKTGVPAQLWCHGPPGAGKSMLASIAMQYLVQNVEDESHVVLRFFCDFASRKKQTKDAVWNSLLSQAIVRGGALMQQTLGDLRSQFGIARPISFKDLSTVISSLCSSQQVIIVIDGLDELGSISEIRATLHPLIEGDCRMLVFSRHLPEISSMLASALTLEVKADPNDLQVYVNNAFQLNGMEDVLDEHPELGKEVIEKSDRIFLIVKILVNHLLELSTLKEMRMAVRSYSSHLEQAFESTLSRIDAQSKSHSELAHRVMGWITSAERKLHMSELLHGLAVEEGNVIDKENIPSKKTILKVCGGLVVVDAHTGIVSMVHATVYTWYRNRAYDNVQADIATACLRYLNLDVLSSGPVNSSAEMDARLKDLPFLAYAARYWRVHVSNKQEAVLSKLHPVILNYIDKMLESLPRSTAAFQAANYKHHIMDAVVRSATFDTMPTDHTYIHFIAFWNLPDKLCASLEKSNNINALDSQNWTPLHWALFARSTASAEVLISRGADVHAKDSAGWTPLFRASLNGDTNLVEALLRNGANHLEQDNHQWTALRWAVALQHAKVIEILMKHHEKQLSGLRKLSKNSLRDVTVQTALQYASSDTPETSLLSELADLSGQLDPANKDCYDLYRVLANDKIGLDKLWSKGHFDTPVGNAWRTMDKAERIYGVESYISEADRRIRGGDGSVAKWRAGLLHAAIRDDNLIAVKLILNLGADVNDRGYRRTHLHAATFREDPSFAELLLKHGAEIEARDYQGLTSLQQAVLNGFDKVVKLLVSKGADVNTCYIGSRDSRHLYREGNSAAKTPLMLACGLLSRNDRTLQIIKVLLKNGADANAAGKANDGGMKVVHYAAQTQSPDVIQSIIQAGAECKELDALGRTAFHHLALGRNYKHATQADEVADSVALLLGVCGSDFISKTAVWMQSRKTSSWTSESMMTKHTPLSIAVAEGEWKLAQVLHDLGARIDTDVPLECLLPNAVQALQSTFVDKLIQNGAKFTHVVSDWINWWEVFRNMDNATPRDLARFKTILERLKTCGFDINMMLHAHPPVTIHELAVAVNSTGEIAQLLLDEGADPYRPYGTGLDAFLDAALRDRADYLQCLLDYARKHPKTDHWTYYLGGQIETTATTVEYQISKAISVAGLIEVFYNNAQTLLSLAVAHGSVKLVQALLANQARANTCGEDGRQPIHIAASQGRTAVVDILIHHGKVNLDALDSRRRTPLHLAAMQGHTEAIKILLSESAAPDIVDTYGFQPVHLAARGHFEAFRLLLQANPSSICMQTQSVPPEYEFYRPSAHSVGMRWAATPLHLAAMNGNLQMVQLILDTAQNTIGVDIAALVRMESNSLEDENGVKHTWYVTSPGAGPTALHIALDRGTFYGNRTSSPLSPIRLEIAELLIERGAAVQGVIPYFTLEHVVKFQGFEHLWDKLRAGIECECPTLKGIDC